MWLQPPLAQGDGPVALIMAPTRELVVQIGKDIRRFSKALSLSIVCAYGGSAVAGQISDLKRGAEVQSPLHLLHSTKKTEIRLLSIASAHPLHATKRKSEYACFLSHQDMFPRC